MTAPVDKAAQNRGQAIMDLVAWIKSDGTAKALEAMQLLDLSDDDLETLLRSHVPENVIRIPHLGRVR